MNIYIYIYVYMYMCIYVYVYIYVYIHICFKQITCRKKCDVSIVDDLYVVTKV